MWSVLSHKEVVVQPESRGRWGEQHVDSMCALGSRMALTLGRGETSVFSLSQLSYF